MASRVFCRQGDITAAETDLTVYSGRKGVPIFDTDGKTPLIKIGQRWAQGESNLGTFVIEDPNGELTTGGFNVPNGTLLTWTEDAAGCAYWLSRGRVVSRDAGRGAAKANNEQEYDVTVEDGNRELKGQPFTEDWVRPAETDYTRLVALQQYILNGSSSTAPHNRDTCIVTVHDSHLAKNASTVLMGAKTYPKETVPADVVADCAATAGKDFGVVIHHVGGGTSTLLETWTWDGGTNTYTLHAANSPDGMDHLVTMDVAPQCGSAGGSGVTGGAEGTNCYARFVIGASPSMPLMKASPGQVFGLSGWCWSYAEDPAQMQVVWYSDLSGTIISTQLIGSSFSAGGWRQWSGTTAAAPAGTVAMQFGMVKPSDGTYKTGWADQWRVYSGGLPTSGAGIGSDVGNCSHLCLQYLVPTDLSTNACTLKISDRRADVNEDTVTPPTVLAPRWLQGKATTADGQTLLSALLYEYQTATGAGAVFTENAARTAANDYWADVFSDSLVSTPAEAATRAVSLLNTRISEHDTHRVSIPIAADQINTIACGMAIQIKAASVTAGAYLGTYFTRRIVQLVWEPRNDGYYWAHLELNRPERLSGTATGVGATPGDPSKAAIVSGTYSGQTIQQALETITIQATPLTTLGDMLYRGAGGSNTRLAIGPSNTHLRSDGTKPVWSPETTALADPMTTIGDIIVRNASNATARLGIGASNTVLTALGSGAAPVWATAPSGGTTSPLTTKGDVYGYSSTNARIPIGTDAQVLTADSTQTLGLKWASLPADAGTRVYNSAAFSVGASAETAVTFDTERSDSDAFHSTSSNTSRLTVPTGKAGRYVIAGTVEWAASALGTLRRLSIRLNGTTYIAKTEITSIINAALPQEVSTVYDLVAGDYVELVAFQDTVGAVNLQASGNYSPEFGMMLVGAGSSGATTLPGWVSAFVGTSDSSHYYWTGSDLAGFTEQTVTGTASWTESQNLVSAVLSNQTTDDVSAKLIAKTFAVGDAWVVAVRSQVIFAATATNTGNRSIGICFTDGTATGSNVVAGHLQIANDVSGTIMVGRHGTLTAISTAPWVSINQGMATGYWVYIKLIYQAANTFRLQFSNDGITYHAFGAADIAKTMTPSYVGICGWMAANAGNALMTWGPLVKTA